MSYSNKKLIVLVCGYCLKRRTYIVKSSIKCVYCKTTIKGDNKNDK